MKKKDLRGMTVKEMQQYLKTAGISGYSNKPKAVVLERALLHLQEASARKTDGHAVPVQAQQQEIKIRAVPRLAANGLQNPEWAKTIHAIQKQALFTGICRIHKEHALNRYFPNATGMFVAWNPSIKRIEGFLIFSAGSPHIYSSPGVPDPWRACEVDLVCSRLAGIGRQLMMALETEARALKCRFIHLTALENVIWFYRKLGFHSPGDDLCRENSQLTLAAKSIAHLRFTTLEQSIDNAELQNVLTRHPGLFELVKCL
jgi:GNAT superfamily N-acetyltransferase